jgi:hypothetical protein
LSKNSQQFDFFQPPQGDLFAGEPARNPGVGVANPDEVRRRLHKMLAEARAAAGAPPWNERTTRVYQIVFPQMTQWLPEAEAQQLRLEFEIELRRLTQAVQQ